MARIGGSRRKTRKLLKKKHREKGKISLKNYLQEFQEGERVELVLDPAIHEGTFHPRFSGKNGVIVGKQGDCYKVKVKDGDKEKTLISHPSHLREVDQ